jgi:hypothetical protein
MNILELEKFKIEDAINFHDEYNPLLFDGDKLKPVIKRQLDIITNDFIEYMGIPDLAVEDVIITGSNVAYTYTPHSDIDLHLLVDFAKLPNSDVYKELFNAKKSLYNDTYEITIRDIPVELYVQDTAQAHTSLGEYSLYKDEFTRIPTKKRANLDEISAEAKFERLEELCIEGLKTKDLDKVNEVLSIIKRYRQAGLDNKGEFGPENLAFKAIRSKGYFQALFDLRNKLRAQQLSIEEELLRRTFEESIGITEQEVELSEEGVAEQYGEYGVGMLARRYDVSRKEIAKQVDLGVRLEMRHNPKVSAITPELRREQASEIARNNIAKRLDYYQHYDKHMQESLRYDLDQKYDEYGMPDYTKYLNAISRFVRYTKSKGEIIQRLLKQFPNIDKRDAKMLINRWEVVKHHRRKDAESLISEEKQYALYINGKPTVRHSSRTEIEKHIAYLKSKGIKGEYDIRFVDFSPRKTSTTLGEEKDVDDWSDEDLKNLSLDMQKAAKEFKAEYKKLNKQRAKYGLEPIDINEASGYIPSEAERNDPRFSRALSVDVHPDTMKKQAKAMGLGNIARDGRPPLLRPGKSTTKKKSNPNKDFGKGIY